MKWGWLLAFTIVMWIINDTVVAFYDLSGIRALPYSIVTMLFFFLGALYALKARELLYERPNSNTKKAKKERPQ